MVRAYATPAPLQEVLGDAGRAHVPTDSRSLHLRLDPKHAQKRSEAVGCSLQSLPMVEPQSVSAELIARVARQDRRALELLYERHVGTALAIAKRLVGRISEAEDVVQEAFVEVWRRADHYDVQRGTGEAWIYGIVRNRAIDKLRHRTVVLRVVGDAGREQLVREQATVTPLEEASQRQARVAVAQALKEIPAEQRVSLELAYYEGLSHSEIAQRTGEPLGTVKTRIRSAMEKLSKLLRAHQ